LEYIEDPKTPLSYKVIDNMRLSKDETQLTVNPSPTLAGFPPEVFQYRLGNRSALDWVIDQYRVTEDKRSGIRSDPNREDDEEYIVRMVGQVVRVSVETVKIVAGLPGGVYGVTPRSHAPEPGNEERIGMPGTSSSRQWRHLLVGLGYASLYDLHDHRCKNIRKHRAEHRGKDIPGIPVKVVMKNPLCLGS
jgi:hypothetical protein